MTSRAEVRGLVAWIGYPVRLFRRLCWPASAPDFEQPEDYGLRPDTFCTAAADGVQIRGWVFTPPTPCGVVILCHARGTSKSRVLGQTKLLYERGLLVVSFDFRGCGESGSSPRRVWNSLWEPIRDLSAVATYVERRFADDPVLRTRMALMGCSFGGNMILAYASMSNRTHPALVFDSTPLMHWADILHERLQRERRGSRAPRLHKAIDSLIVRVLVTWTRAEALYRRARRSAQKMHGISVLLIVGERDQLFDIEASCRFAHTHFPGGTEVWRVPRGRHLTNHLVAPDEYAERVSRFLTAAFAASDLRLHESSHVSRPVS